MTTVASPVSVRDQALAVIARRLNAEPACQMRLGEIRGAVVAQLLCDLEQAFGIGLDVDEVLPNGTVGVLLELVCARVRGMARLHHWDDERARRGLPLHAPRPRPVAVEPKALVEPIPWPLAYAPPPRTACAAPVPLAVPSDEAWDAALAGQALETSDRWLSLLIVAGAAFLAAIGACWWVDHLAGLR